MRAFRAWSIILIIFSGLLAAPTLAGWTPATRISDETTAYNPRIVASADTLHVVYWTAQDRPYYLRSINNGLNWEEPFCIMDTVESAGGVSPNICSYYENLIVIWYNGFRNSDDVNWGFRRSEDGGGVWQGISYVLPVDDPMLQQYAISIGGAVYIVYSKWNQEIIIEFTESTDWGESWTEPTEVFRTQETGRVDMVARGDTIHFVWAGRFSYDDEWEIYYIRSTDSGESWSENTMFSTYDEYGSNFPTISMNSIGDIAVCWMDYKDSPDLWTGDLFVKYSFDSGDTWTEEDQLTFAHGAFANRILWQGDSINIAWEDWRYSQRDIFYMLSTDNGLTWGDEMRVEDNPQASGFPDIAVVGDKRHLVWYDRRDDLGNGIYYSRWDEEVGIEEDNEVLPLKLSLRAYPNPFNGNTTITYSFEEGGEIEIFNIAGQKIRTLMLPAREGKIIWDARDALGNKVSSGIYFARARAPQKSNTIKLIYLK